MKTWNRCIFLAVVATGVVFGGCSSSGGSGNGDAGVDTDGTHPPPQPGTEPGIEVTAHPAAQGAEEQALRAQIAAAAEDAPAFAAAYPAPAPASLTYTPHEAAGMDLVQAGAFALTAPETAALDANGFVISAGKAFPSFLYGYNSVYALDLPVYVTGDAVLHAVHHSYDTILKALEMRSLRGLARDLGTRLRANLAAGGAGDFDATTRADVDLYLAVFENLLHLDAAQTAPVAGADPAMVNFLVDQARKGEGTASVILFGQSRDLDFSQFTPRGHYTHDPRLKAYFRALMWLGRTEFRFLEADGDTGKLNLRRRDVAAAYALDALFDETTRAEWKQMDDTIRAFVGDADNLTLPELPKLLADLHVAKGADLAGVPDQALADAILAGGYGAQQIASQLIVNGTDGELPLNRSFLLLGQRYVIDSHVFSNVTWARTTAQRMMPDPLDVAFAALGNNTAGALLAPELEKYGYWPDLAQTRILVEGHGADYWQSNLYTLWLGALRNLQPEAAAVDGLPPVFQGAAFQKRLLNSQLASWAELRHDTLLYAKQSYSDGASCSFPDAYVEPFPAFWGALADFGRVGHDLVSTLEFGGEPDVVDPIPADQQGEEQYVQWVDKDQALGWFAELESSAGILKSMAESERTGTPFDDAQMAFINQAIHIEWICGGASVDGWLARLYVNPAGGADQDVLVADVHTQPTDETGTPVGRILEVGTGWPRLGVFTVDTCEGPRAYVGVTSLFHQTVTEDYKRLTDEDWARNFVDGGTQPAVVPWMSGVVVGGDATIVPPPVTE